MSISSDEFLQDTINLSQFDALRTNFKQAMLVVCGVSSIVLQNDIHSVINRLPFYIAVAAMEIIIHRKHILEAQKVSIVELLEIAILLGAMKCEDSTAVDSALLSLSSVLVSTLEVS
jgi:hypothetical protein